MRFNPTPVLQFTVRLSFFAALALTGCTAKQEIAPKDWCGTDPAACSTKATVRFCLGKTLICPTEHTTLELADGTRLQPTGPTWEAYLARQTDGQKVSIGYSATGPVTNGSPATLSAALSCLTTESR
ncbi:hypothetical protein [Hymenobacter algoricola]|uniref:Uncharacterized protein n=1 Tax=Hymenobacter algoricola TaxID=486267 RepID=A0ABP7NEM6_9BACT